MTVLLKEDGTICLEGQCTVEDAEPLLQLLLDTSAALVDWRRSEHVHTAVIQILLAARPQLIGPPGDQWMRQWVGHQVQSGATVPSSPGRPSGD